MKHPRQPALANAAGVGYRQEHHKGLLSDDELSAKIPFVEALADNHLPSDKKGHSDLLAIAERYPTNLHSVGMNLGGSDPLDQCYLQQLRQLAEQTNAPLLSDHLCWTADGQRQLHELMPLPYTDEAINHCATRIQQAQDILGRRIMIENVSSYLSYDYSAHSEAEFVAAIVEAADCDLLLDVNNIYVSAKNHGFDPASYLSRIPADRVKEYHLAGYSDEGSHLLDTHGAKVSDPVWALFETTLTTFGPRPTVIEWDQNIPAIEVLLAESSKAQIRIEQHT